MENKEKNEAELYEGNSSDGVEVATAGFDPKSTKRLLRKIDMRLIPFLALLYLLSFLDRTNIGNARLAGLEADLGMKGLQYNVRLPIVKHDRQTNIMPRMPWPCSSHFTYSQRFHRTS
jgi:hypothetical protein